MTIEQFSAANYNVQQAIIRVKGSLLLQRSANKSTATLYQIDNFYVEITSHPTSKGIQIIRCFTVKDVDVYLPQIDISSIRQLLA